MKENAQKKRKERTTNMSDAHLGKSALPEESRDFSSWKIVSEEGSQPVEEGILSSREDSEKEPPVPENVGTELEDVAPSEVDDPNSLSEAEKPEPNDSESPETSPPAPPSQETTAGLEKAPGAMNMLEALESEPAHSTNIPSSGKANTNPNRPFRSSSRDWSPQRVQALLTRMKPSIAIPRNNPELRDDLFDEDDSHAEPEDAENSKHSETVDDFFSQRNAQPFRESTAKGEQPSHRKADATPANVSENAMPASEAEPFSHSPKPLSDEQAGAEHESPSDCNDSTLLLRVQQAWPGVPESMRQTIVALVEAAAAEK
jgi:hypothetical protein